MGLESKKNNNQNIAVFSKHLNWLNWEQMAQTAYSMGFYGIDLTVRPDGHVLPERVEDDLPKLYEICEKAGIKIEMICTTIQDAAEPATEKILKTASQLGIKNYRMGWYFYDENICLHENLKIFTSKMKDLADINKQYNIKGNYQNHDGSNWFGAPVWDLGKVLTEINSNWLGCQYDILNATIEAANAWEVGFELIAPYIYTIDIKDAIWTFDNGELKLKYVPLGEGMVNFKRFMELINKFNINVPFSLHMEYDLGGAERGLSYLKIPSYSVISAMEKDLAEFKSLLHHEKHYTFN